jgi:diguanylate cyclase (GGDEF)-like protein/PAS domain S-box-containing protein
MLSITKENQDLFDQLFNGVYITDRDRRILYWNHAAEKITGFSADEVLGKFCADNILTHTTEKGENLCLGACPLSQTLQDGLNREATVFLHHKSGHRLAVFVRVIPLYGDTGEIDGAIEIFAESSNNTALEEELALLRELSLQDSLTRVCNRRRAMASLEEARNEADRLKSSYGILMIDIDFFKTVNDTYGHPIGDRVLQMVAKTLSSNVRSFDSICRWGGEEFIGVIRHVDQVELAVVAEKLRTLVAQSYFEENDRIVRVTVSIGAAIAQLGESPDPVIERADAALYESKENGRDKVTVL